MTEDLLVRRLEESWGRGQTSTSYGLHRVLMVREDGEMPDLAGSEELEVTLLEVRAVRLTTRLRCLQQLLLQLADHWTASYLVAAAQVRREERRGEVCLRQ